MDSTEAVVVGVELLFLVMSAVCVQMRGVDCWIWTFFTMRILIFICNCVVTGVDSWNSFHFVYNITIDLVGIHCSLDPVKD